MTKEFCKHYKELKLRVSFRKCSPISQKQDKDASFMTAILHFTKDSIQGNSKRKRNEKQRLKKKIKVVIIHYDCLYRKSKKTKPLKLREFRKILNYRISYTKDSTFLFADNRQVQRTILESVKEIVKNLRDFGIYLTKDVKDSYRENYLKNLFKYIIYRHNMLMSGETQFCEDVISSYISLCIQCSSIINPNSCFMCLYECNLTDEC